MLKKWLPIALLVPFTIFTTELVLRDGYFGFVRLAMREGWALQMLLDVGIMVLLFTSWLIPDARARKLSPWPWVVASMALGSVGALGYLVYRQFARQLARDSDNAWGGVDGRLHTQEPSIAKSTFEGP